MARAGRSFYAAWIGANAVAECLGLGGTLALGSWAATSGLISDSSAASVLGAAAGAIVAGTWFEGVLLGSCQAWVLRRDLPGFAPTPWILATALGAGLAWTLGMVPSTVMSLLSSDVTVESATAASATAEELPLWLTLLLAAGMGVVLGPFLGVPQGRVLQHHGGSVARWAWANSLAWAAGMPVVFLGTAWVDERSGGVRIALVVGVSTLLAGAVVGAIHGRWLRPLIAAPVVRPTSAPRVPGTEARAPNV